jgi:hypothetical protein
MSQRPVNASHSQGSSPSALAYASTACSGAFPLRDNEAIIKYAVADVEAGASIGKPAVNTFHRDPLTQKPTSRCRPLESALKHLFSLSIPSKRITAFPNNQSTSETSLATPLSMDEIVVRSI